MSSNSEAIRSLNDRFRTNLPHATGIPGRFMITAGVRQLTDDEAEPGKSLADLVRAVRTFDEFSSENDPYHEHDFGAFDFRNERLFWKIDYYANDLMHGSSDASDPSITVRVLTIMLASEY